MNFLTSLRNTFKPGIQNIKKRMFHNNFELPYNEPISNLNRGSSLRDEVTEQASALKNKLTNIPIVINGKKIFTEKKLDIYMPSDLSKNIVKCSLADTAQINQAIQGSLSVHDYWRKVPFSEKESIFMKACHLLTTKYRSQMLACTMIGQAKTAYQADIDCIGELSDFLRFNIAFAKEIYKGVKLHQSTGVFNSLLYRPLEGFVSAISPFNFTAIGGNLCTAPCMMGNVVLWKPSNQAILSNYLFYEILLESGLPDSVIQFLPCEGETFGSAIFNNENFACLNFTGSTESFQNMWNHVGRNISLYKNFPRLIGETGGKNYHLIHESANLDLVVNCTLRSAFEYGGQKCSACSVIYVPESLYAQFINNVKEKIKLITLGQPDDYKSFLSSVIDRKAFNRIKSYIKLAESDSNVEILFGGKCDDSKGYFIDPTIIKVNDINHNLLREEIFGPVLSIYSYKNNEWDDVISHINTKSKYSLCGAIFCQDRNVLMKAEDKLIYTAGNFYVNDKSTGSIVGQQPFGGARKSGTNDKAGMMTYLLKFVSPYSRKENYQYSSDIDYSYMK